jgi:hypothetical protein
MDRTLPEGSGVSISIGAGSGSSRSFVPGGSSEVGDPGTIWSGGPVVASGDWDPAAVIAPGSSTGPGSMDPDPSAEELLSSCRSCGSGRLATSTILTASEVAIMYSSRGSPGFGAAITGGEVRYLLSSRNASYVSSV